MTTRCATLLVVAAAVLAPGEELRAQPGRWDGLGPHLGVRAVALQQDDYFTGAWTPGFAGSLRLPLAGVVSAHLSVSGTWTHRLEERACAHQGPGSCPEKERVSGLLATGAGSLEVNLPINHFERFVLGVGYGRVADLQQEGMLEYQGPAWIWDVSFQRLLGPDWGLELGYRQLRVEWDIDSTALRGTPFTYHQIGVGVILAP